MSYFGHTVIENRNGLIVKTQASLVVGFGKRETAITLLTGLSGKHKSSQTRRGALWLGGNRWPDQVGQSESLGPG